MCLQLTKEDKPIGPYAPLSHRWGKDADVLVLAQSNLDTLRARIPTILLPKTFADATDIARRLGLGYLWIDSLCILQTGDDSKEDWFEHATQTAFVYQNGVLNISADVATNPNHGIYSARDPTMVSRLCVSERTASKVIFMDDFCGRRALRSAGLSKRGWVVQERILSPQILHMEKHQILWECLDLALACEYHPNGVPMDSSTYISRFPSSLMEGSVTQDANVRQQSEIMARYHQTRQHYTECNLSFPDSDKLIAFSAIVRQAAPLLKSE